MYNNYNEEYQTVEDVHCDDCKKFLGQIKLCSPRSNLGVSCNTCNSLHCKSCATKSGYFKCRKHNIWFPRNSRSKNTYVSRCKFCTTDKEEIEVTEKKNLNIY